MARSLSTALIVAMITTSFASAADLESVSKRFKSADGKETPDFRRHMMPLLGKLGCNGRACHGSFQGQGGFRLSLFGYDFKLDHEGLAGGDEPRVLPEYPDESLALHKGALEVPHRGGKRMDVGSWEYNVFLKWIAGGAKAVTPDDSDFVRLEVTPSEIVFQKKGEKVQLKAVAVWADGTREDVTPICRFQTNSGQVAEISKNGLITSNESGDTHVVVFYDTGVVPIPVMQPVSEFAGKNYPKATTPTQVDKLVIQKLRKLGIVQSDLSTDAAFLRRVSLDMTGTLPSAEEIKNFLADGSPNKRAKKVDELLETPAYAAWWATRLCDFTGNNDTNLNNVTPARGQAGVEWYEWIRKRVADNTPYDELAAGIVLGNSRNEGESYTEYAKSMSKLYRPNPKGNFADRDSMPYFWARRNFRLPEERVIGFAYSFMGIRIQCAQCHKHPFDRWTKDDFDQFKGFLTATTFGNEPGSRDEMQTILKALKIDPKLRGNQQRREFTTKLREGKVVPFQEVFTLKPPKNQRPNNPKRPQRNRGRGRVAKSAKLLGGDVIDLTKVDDSRKPLMAWLRDPKNEYFAKAFVNRVWSAYFNVGIVEPPDNLALANPPSNKPLLGHLTQGFIESGFDMKWIHREIANSRTYQLSWKPNDTNRLDENNFARAVPRRMPAEVAFDAIQFATYSDSRISELRSNPTGRAIMHSPVGQRAGNRGSAYALSIFGRSTRESNCDCDRSMEASLLQTVYLQNDREVLAAIDRRNTGWLDQVSKELGARFQPKVTAAATGGRRRQPVSYKQRLAQAQKQLEQAKKQGNDKLVTQLERRIAFFKKAAKGGNAGQAANASKRLAQLQQQIVRAKKQGNDKLVKQLRQRLTAFRKQAEKPAARPGTPAASGEKVAELNASDVVKQAYLRTLSRYPTDEELSRSRQYIEESGDTVDGIRGLLWALLNTKEFIVNH
jgi:hypothetical protein